MAQTRSTDPQRNDWRAIGTAKNKESKSQFFQAAAALANPDLPKPYEEFGLAIPENALLDAKSKFLEPAYQELAHSFYASFSPLQRSHVDRARYAAAISKLERAFDVDAQAFFNAEAVFHKENVQANAQAQLFSQPQKDVYRNGVVFFADEIASLVFAFSGFAQTDKQPWHREQASSAPEFHEALLAILTAERPQSFVLSTTDVHGINNATLDRARLHWAWRLKKKSDQISAGTEADTKYFHAELLDSANSDRKFDFVYWLKFDAWGKAVAGEFLGAPCAEGLQPAVLDLWIPHERVLQNLLRAPFDSAFELVFSKVLSLYAESK